MIKDTIKKIPLAKPIITSVAIAREYRYDRRFFKKNYSRSYPTKEKVEYNILLITHALEKGMSNKHLRQFGKEKVSELIGYIEQLRSFPDYENDFAFICAINVLRSYKKLYQEQMWEESSEYRKVSAFLKNYIDVPGREVGSTILHKKDFIDEAQIDYKSFLSSRHSVREFQKKELLESDIEKCIEEAILSPSACNRQMCKIYYIKNKGIARKIIHTAQGFGGFEQDTINLFIVTFDVSANYFIGERNQGWFNAGLFSMNFVNSLHSHGIGSCFCQFGSNAKIEESIKKLTHISKSERIAVLISAGYYCDECKIPMSSRKTVTDVFKIC